MPQLDLLRVSHKRISLRFSSAMRFQAVSGQAISGQEGSGLILILVLLSIASITMMGAMTIGGVQQKTRTQSILPYHVQLMRGNIANILRRPLNWSQTASDSGNPSMACISGSSTCPTATPQPIYVIKTAADTGTSYTYKVGGTNGITPSGQACVGYPSETCPISFDVRWTCDANCANPATRTFSVSVTPAYNPAVGTGTSKTLIAFDASKYVINFPLSSTTSYFYKP